MYNKIYDAIEVLRDNCHLPTDVIEDIEFDGHKPANLSLDLLLKPFEQINESNQNTITQTQRRLKILLHEEKMIPLDEIFNKKHGKKS